MSGAGLGSTYRLQLSGLGFDRAASLVPYLDRLGVATLYVSPVTRAAPGSRHGYDVIDPTTVDPALGGRAGWDRLLDALAERGLRVLIDIVPNHMSTSTENPWWFDVLRRGRASPVADVFDIDWEAGAGRVVLPVLDAPVDDLLASGAMTVDDEVLRLGDQAYPLADRIEPEHRADPAHVLSALDDQHYRLAQWRQAATEVNYRRFFDINGLVGVRVEDPAVFDRTHSLVLELAADDRVAGLRVDHVDGLLRPAEYLERLAARLSERRREPPVVVVEKILARNEQVPARWPVGGTTGYEFADMTLAVLTDGDGAAALVPLGGPGPPFEEVERRARRQELDRSFAAQLRSVARALDPCADADGAGLSGVAALTAAMPVYRTYVSAGGVSEADRAVLVTACARVAALDPDDAPGARRAADAVAGAPAGGGCLGGTERWQQLCAAVVAKGTEDTALYRFGGLLSAADVGSNPARPAVAVDDFHRWAGGRAHGSLNTTSTHDAKRSRSVRCRLAVLAEIPTTWSRAVGTWRPRHRPLSGRVELDALAQHVLYQTLLALWDDDDRAARCGRALVKAAREAGVRTSWTDPDTDYETALQDMVDALFRGDDPHFALEMDAVVADIGAGALANELAAVVLSATVPGVPDVYQGTETVRPLLVDPDNRRPVAFDELAVRLDEPRGPPPAGAGDASGTVLRATARLLCFRRSHPALFAGGGYVRLEARGPAARHVIAFARRSAGDMALVVVPRLSRTLAGAGRLPVAAVWEDTTVVLPRRWAARWADVLDGHDVPGPEIAVGDALAALPSAVLVPGR